MVQRVAIAVALCAGCGTATPDEVVLLDMPPWFGTWDGLWRVDLDEVVGHPGTAYFNLMVWPEQDLRVVLPDWGLDTCAVVDIEQLDTPFGEEWVEGVTGGEMALYLDGTALATWTGLAGERVGGGATFDDPPLGATMGAALTGFPDLPSFDFPELLALPARVPQPADVSEQPGLDGGIEVQWPPYDNPPGVATHVTVFAFNGVIAPVPGFSRKVWCRVRDDGAFEVPGYAIALLGAPEGGVDPTYQVWLDVGSRVRIRSEVHDWDGYVVAAHGVEATDSGP